MERYEDVLVGFTLTAMGKGGDKVWICFGSEGYPSWYTRPPTQNEIRGVERVCELLNEIKRGLHRPLAAEADINTIQPVAVHLKYVTITEQQIQDAAEAEIRKRALSKLTDAEKRVLRISG